MKAFRSNRVDSSNIPCWFVGIDFLKTVENPKTILIIKPSSLGDVVHTLPAVSVVKRRFPDAKLHWVVNTEWAPLLKGNPDLESIIEFPRRSWRGWRDFGKARSWARENLGSLQPDLALDFQGLLRSGLLIKASRAKQKVGFRQAREGASLFYDHKITVENWKQKHAVDRYLELVSGTDEEVTFSLPEGDPISGIDCGGAVLFHPFSRGKGKSLSFDEVEEFCNALAPRKVIVVGAGVDWPEERAFPENGTNLLGKTSIAELICLMRQSEFVVSVDSGPMHLAAGISDRVLSIHTWTDPLMVGPYQKAALIYRDGQIVQMADVKKGAFPEERSRKNAFVEGSRLLEETAMEKIAERIRSEIGCNQSFN